ncbi:neuropeptides capa receptor-like [Acanthaster planci]|uniref:Neuropeptides capa receptor-like n=1 Tax=Acanthaster planci TaxID=133434 RepID=A0A8B7YWR7_ACAPL|nr:neuropeptides capa receptor-like [Acanthaster planci]
MEVMNYSSENSSAISGLSECEFPMLNLTDESKADVYMLNAATAKVILTVMFIILAFGVPGNMAFLLMVFRVQAMRNATNMYLTSLAVVDLTFLSISIFNYFLYFNNSIRTHLKTTELVGCVGAFILPYFTYFLSVSTVTLVTLDKYNAVCNPIRYVKGRNKQRALWLIIGSWVVAVLLAGLIALRFAKLTRLCALWPEGEKYQDLPVLVGYCGAVSSAGLIIGHVVEVVVFFIALVANAFMYGRIILYLSARVDRKKQEQQAVPTQATQIRNQVSRLLITFGTVFFLCQFPFVIISLTNLVDYLLGTPLDVSYRKFVLPLTISHVFIFLNSAINPVIYNLTSSIYRQAFKEVVCGVCLLRERKRRKRVASVQPDMCENSFENHMLAEEGDVDNKEANLETNMEI